MKEIGYYEQQLNTMITLVEPLGEAEMEEVRARWDTLCKPLKSLGKLEDMVIRLGGIRHSSNPKIRKKAVIIMAGDNGIVEEGISQTGQEVTCSVIESMTKNGSAVCVMAQLSKADVVPVDIGMAIDPVGEGIVRKKVSYGTKNFRKEPAMTREECANAILNGIETVKELVQKGYDTFAIGEMGIGNTTTSSAICTAYFGCEAKEVTGRGAGLSTKAYEQKIALIDEAVALHQPDKEDVLDLLSKVGGLEIAGMAGCFIGASLYRKPIIMDGFISSVSALLAISLCPLCKEYIFPSHCSKEPAGKRVLDEIGLEPYFVLDMCMGEGTGAVMGFSVLDYALACYQKIPRFEENKIEKYVPLS